MMYRGGFYRGGPILMSAIAGIDQALWDIKGKACDMSVAQMLGGQVRERIKVYSWIGGDRPADTAAAARVAVDRGFTAVKMNGTEELQIIDTWDRVQAALDRVAAVTGCASRSWESPSTSTAEFTSRWPRCCSRSWSHTG